MPDVRGAFADAARAREQDLAQRLETAVEVDRAFADALRGACRKAAWGRRRLDAIEVEISDVVARQGILGLDTPAGARQFQAFLATKTRQIHRVVDEVSADSTSRTGILRALRYPMGDGLPLAPPIDTLGGERRWTDADLYPHDPTAADVKQDSVGDCYLDATMGAIANANPQWIKDRIHFDSQTGAFDVTLWDGHEWKHLDVTQADIDTDIRHNGASWLDNGRPDAALWPAVLESAYAKLKYPGRDLSDALGNDVGIGQGGYAKDAMEALTGNRGTVINPESVWFTNQHIDQAISGALANHQPVTISTTPQGAPLTQSHVYVVEGINGTGSDAMVTLRNPWETNAGTPIDTPDALVTVRLGDLIGSGLPGPLGTHPMSGVNIGSLG
ncbi:DUF4226 domain-containing protein [Mycolicibacter virginiensis]|uniref:Calpain catalytic domain-containing protein n=1 Tax=Mycolicibacter virginiensis TaxID=1795032 RepID=A0A9X7NX43_9MYCO|nr:DUF4226 domain-containing protein [Mycolicibacter virginiensis]PQM50587.1 hypothetical protein C5U48_19560 [Mycolicibacter virginiensis]ULP48105.1 DUF4226 domain-containing protein [Mycolicibacter virginiensis]